MARPLRIEFEGAVYHVTTRGDRKEPIFTDDADRSRLLDVFDQAMHRFDAEAFAYCLMGNHYHLVLRTRRANLSALMRHVNGVYTQGFNRRHDIGGHLFQGRFHSILVDCDAYLLTVCRYVELNPVRAGLVAAPGDWGWSSYRAHVGRERAPPWLDRNLLHGYMLAGARGDDDLSTAQERYAEFVEAGRDERLWNTALRQEIFLGDDDFIDRAQRRVELSRKASKEIPASQLRSPFMDTGMAMTESKGEAFRRAFVEGGLRMSDIARKTQMSPSQVSRLIGTAEARARAGCVARDAPHGEAQSDPPAEDG